MAFKRIAVAVDYSDFSQHAVRVADELAQQSGASLTLIHVIPITMPLMVDLTVMLPPPELTKLTASADTELRAWTKTLGTPSERIHISAPTGDPVASLVEASVDYDLMVVGTHGRRGVTRALLGSVAERVARGATCPVLIARLRESKR